MPSRTKYDGPPGLSRSIFAAHFRTGFEQPVTSDGATVLALRDSGAGGPRADQGVRPTKSQIRRPVLRITLLLCASLFSAADLPPTETRP